MASDRAGKSVLQTRGSPRLYAESAIKNGQVGGELDGVATITTTTSTTSHHDAGCMMLALSDYDSVCKLSILSLGRCNSRPHTKATESAKNCANRPLCHPPPSHTHTYTHHPPRQSRGISHKHAMLTGGGGGAGIERHIFVWQTC